MIDFIRRIIIQIIFKIIPLDYINKILEQDAYSKITRSAIVGNNVRMSSKTKVFNHFGDRNVIRIDENSVVYGELLTFGFGGNISIGKDCFVGENSKIWSADQISIGNDVLISHNVNVIDTSSHELNYDVRAASYKRMLIEGHSCFKGEILTAPILIEDNAWLNMNCIILRGVTIGKGAIIAAGAVVTKSVPPFTMVAGNPAKVIKKIS
jgi:acetyltransferase-like isoleucine patch superfamily enzyme